MEQVFNESFKVETYDVANIKKSWRIIYCPREKTMLVTKSFYQAQVILATRMKDGGIMLTRTKAPKAFPDVFMDSEVKVSQSKKMRKFLLKMPSEQFTFCARHGNISAYIRSLIDKEMQNL